MLKDGALASMTVRRLVALSAVAAIAAGALLALSDLQHLLPLFRDPDVTFSQIARTPTWAVHAGSHLAAAFLLVLALPGLYLAQADRMRAWGTAAYALALVGVVAYVGAAFIMGLATPVLAEVSPATLDGEASGPIALAFIAYPLSALGMAAFGAATLAARVLPRWIAALLIAGPILQLVGDGLGVPVGVVYGIGVTAAGLALRRTGTVAAAPAPDNAAA